MKTQRHCYECGTVDHFRDVDTEDLICSECRRPWNPARLWQGAPEEKQTQAPKAKVEDKKVLQPKPRAETQSTQERIALSRQIIKRRASSRG